MDNLALAEVLWGLVANVEWTAQTPEWQAAAARARVRYHAALGEAYPGGDEDGPLPRLPEDSQTGQSWVRRARDVAQFSEPSDVGHPV
jgi:hypothetical protein